MTETVSWTGASGRVYHYVAYQIGATFGSQPGNYIFARRNGSSRWSPAYIGQTSDLGQRIASHDKEPWVRLHGATHIHAHVSSRDEDVRRIEEADLIRAWNPPRNDRST